MINLKQICNFKNEEFFIEAESLNEVVKKIKPNKIKKFLFGFAFFITGFTLMGFLLINQAVTPSGMSMIHSEKLDILLLTMISFLTLCSGLFFRSISNIIIYERNKNKLKNILKYFKVPQMKIYNKKEINNIELILNNLSNEATFLLENKYDFNMKKEDSYNENFKVGLIIKLIKILMWKI